MNTPTSGTASNLNQSFTNEANHTSTGQHWQIDLPKLRDMIGSLQSTHKVSSDAHLSGSSATGLLNSGPDTFSFNSNLTEEISKHPHGDVDSAEVAPQLDAIYAQLRAEFQTANADGPLGIATDATTHDGGDHFHAHAVHLM
jgi:hypothetical protein